MSEGGLILLVFGLFAVLLLVRVPVAFSRARCSSTAGRPYLSSFPDSPARGPGGGGVLRTRVAALPASRPS